jgi:hypothetical protein
LIERIRIEISAPCPKRFHVPFAAIHRIGRGQRHALYRGARFFDIDVARFRLVIIAAVFWIRANDKQIAAG